MLRRMMTSQRGGSHWRLEDGVVLSFVLTLVAVVVVVRVELYLQRLFLPLPVGVPVKLEGEEQPHRVDEGQEGHEEDEAGGLQPPVAEAEVVGHGRTTQVSRYQDQWCEDEETDEVTSKVSLVAVEWPIAHPLCPRLVLLGDVKLEAAYFTLCVFDRGEPGLQTLFVHGPARARALAGRYQGPVGNGPVAVANPADRSPAHVRPERR